jgi:hypothetical protein
MDGQASLIFWPQRRMLSIQNFLSWLIMAVGIQRFCRVIRSPHPSRMIISAVYTRVQYNTQTDDLMRQHCSCKPALAE